MVAHPDPDSLSMRVAARIATEAGRAGGTAEVADLVAEGFDPRFTEQDRAAYLAAAGYPDDVLAEQARIERARHLVLVFPVWWWSMPALLKGWIDRVFANGWAFGYDPTADDAVSAGTGRLGRLTVHLVPIASGSEGSYDRHGYGAALRTQISHGVIDYCGAERGVLECIWRSETASPHEIETRLEEIAGLLADRIAAP